MPTSSLLRPVDTELMTPVTQTWCPLFARIESFTNKDKNLDRADNNWLVRQTLYVPTLSSENNHCMVTIFIVPCLVFWSELKLVSSRGTASDHSMKGRHETWHRHGCWSQNWMRALCCQQWILASSWCLICLMKEEKRHCHYSASISDRLPPDTQTDTERRDEETLMSRWPDLDHYQPIRGEHKWP